MPIFLLNKNNTDNNNNTIISRQNTKAPFNKRHSLRRRRYRHYTYNYYSYSYYSDMFRCCLFPSYSSSVANDNNSVGDMPSEFNIFLRRSFAAFFLLAAVFLIYNSARFLRFPFYDSNANNSSAFVIPSSCNVSSQGNVNNGGYRLERVLKYAATKDNTVIITTLNEAWAAPSSIIDLFLESFRIGHHTRELLSHLVIVALDDKAFRRCLSLHPHCVTLVTEGVDFSKEAKFMSPDYLKMMWRRIDFLRSVLELGYNFVFTDADVMWLRDPFPHFDPDTDFQIACDHFSGDPFDVNNSPNGGFNYVKSNNRSIEFYKFWLSSHERYPGYHDQDVLNFIKRNPYISEIGLEMKFLDTANFGGFCEPSKDLNEVCTMHANCCIGLDSKLHDLRILLQDWRLFMSMPPALKRSQGYKWRVPKNCSLSALHAVQSPTKSKEPEDSS